MKQRVPSKDEKKFVNAFYDLMTYMGMLNVYNRTYKLHILDSPNYGYFAHLYLAPGLSFDVLADKRKVIEQNLKCLWIMKVEQFRAYAEVQIVTKPIDEKIEYQNPNVKPWEMYIGMSFAQKIIKINVNKFCMFLIAGATGAGKTRLIYMMLLSWILGCSPSDVWLYLSDIVKNEYINFQTVQHVKYYASELDELYAMMQALQKEFARRKRLLSDLRANEKGTNIEDYNKVNKGNKLAYCYVLIDEFSAVVPEKSDSKDEKAQKEYILAVLKMLSKTGRLMGMFTIMATQKTTRDEIPSIIKNMSTTRISLRANDPISSEVIMGDNSAVGLADRIAVYSTNGGSIQDYLFTPRIEVAGDDKQGSKTLTELLKPYIKTDGKQPTKGKTGLTRGKVTYLPKRGAEPGNLITLFEKEDDYIDYGS